MTNQATFHAGPRRCGTLLGTVLVSTLGLAAVTPGLMLQGVATRPRASTPDDDAEGDPALARPAKPAVADPTVHPALNGHAESGAASAAAAHGAPELGHRPRRPRIKPAVPRAGKSADRAADPERSAGRRPRSAVESEPGAPSAVPSPAAASDRVEAIGVEPVESGLAVTEPTDSGVSQPASEDETRGPVTFEEVQAAHAAAARNYRDLRNSLNEAYRIIGRLNVERYEALMELAELKGTPLPERPPERSWKSAARPTAVTGPRPTAPAPARRLKRRRELEEEIEIDPADVKALGRRRQRLVIGTLLAVALLAVVYRFSGANWMPNLLDRQALNDMAAIGIFMQVFFLLFFLVRLTTLTGKGKSWLFPTPEEEAWKQRRKRVRGR